MKHSFLVRIVAHVLSAALVVGTVQAADVGTAFTFQGHLENDTPPVPVTDTCDFRFGLWDALTLGQQIGASQTPPPVNVDAGQFTVVLDFGVGAFDGTARWLEMEVKCPANPAFILMTPRVELTPAPYSLRAMSGVGPPGSLEVEAGTGDIGIGTASPQAKLDVNGGIRHAQSLDFTGASDAPILRIGTKDLIRRTTAQGAVLIGADDYVIIGDGESPDTVLANAGLLAGQEEMYISSDNNVHFVSNLQSGWLSREEMIFTDTGRLGVGTAIPGGRLHVVDATGGDGSVVLPTDAISASETLDEPGVASATDNTADSILTTPSITTLLFQSITVPAAGYVLAIATLEAQGDAGPDPGIVQCYFAVSSSSATFPTTQRVAASGDNNDPVPVTVHGVFAVTAGNHTFYLLGQEQTGGWTANQMRLTLVYFPTNYGTVVFEEATEAGADLDPTTGMDVTGATTPPPAGNLATARLEREITDLKSRLAAVEDLLRASGSNEPGGER